MYFGLGHVFKYWCGLKISKQCNKTRVDTHPLVGHEAQKSVVQIIVHHYILKCVCVMLYKSKP